jgi:hypothetical protein
MKSLVANLAFNMTLLIQFVGVAKTNSTTKDKKKAETET